MIMGKERIKERLAAAANMPKDVILGVPVVTVTGTGEVCIENYTGILEYTDMIVRIRAKGTQIKISGRRLQIEYYTNDEMKITGAIHSLEYNK